MQAASDLTAFVFVVPVEPLLAPAGVGQKNTFPVSAQPQAPNLSTMALETPPYAPAAQTGSVGVGTDNATPTPTNPQPFSHGEAGDVGSQVSPAPPQADSRLAKANRAPVPVVPPALPQPPSISRARPPSLCLLYTSPSPRDLSTSRMPSSA